LVVYLNKCDTVDDDGMPFDVMMILMVMMMMMLMTS